MEKELRDNPRCFVCGKENPSGLGVDFEIDQEWRSISAKFTPSDIHQGYEMIVHGGVLSALLDEAMVKLTVSLGIPAMTAEMTVKFKAPAAPGEELLVSGRLIHETRRLIHGGEDHAGAGPDRGSYRKITENQFLVRGSELGIKWNTHTNNSIHLIKTM